ncbi:mechanosensitive channel MscK precursor [bacterium BMS3Bbin06]|nr:mechanosensitive channel MscK precursor [bacterium BMS3Abin08]GBE34130.1 mechanosensitive channel MscK precursor [bacterium BMS3Bbin06]HDH00433.1 mechanosensitive ion channel family protein [Nitrospirota bacterium]HDY71780.1 mechanosensitive ion channel family protein [Nitrospirota bacterium]
MHEILNNPLIRLIIVTVALLLFFKIVDLFLKKFLLRLTGITRTSLDDEVIDILHRPIILSLFFLSLIFSLPHIGLKDEAAFYLKSISYTVLVLTWCITLIKTSNQVVHHILSAVKDETGLRKDLIPLIKNISKIIILGTTAFFFLSIWKINLTPLLASAGIAGAVVAFAAKDAMANLFGGISIFFDKPFIIGDYVVLDSGERGEVVTIGVRSTRIKTRDDILITIPNSIIANTKIINESAPIPRFRVRSPVSVAYGSDIDLVEKTLLEVAEGNPNVLSLPSPRVRFRSFGDSALNFELLCWAREPSVRGLTVHELNSAIYREFEKRNIKIPFPQRDVHLYKT